MTRFFLDLNECGNFTADPEGLEYRDLEHAREAAIGTARALMCQELKEGRLCLGCRIFIRDRKGAEVATILFREAVTITGL